MVKSIEIGKFKSDKKGTEYTCLVFDLGYRVVKVFAERYDLMAISGLTAEEFSQLCVGDTIKVI